MPKKSPKEGCVGEKPTQIRIWPELVPYLLNRAETERRSMVQVANLLLEEALINQKPKKY